MKQNETIGAVIIGCDGSVIPKFPEYGTKFTLEELQEIVGGDYQAVTDRKVAIVVDADGKPKNKPVNPYATALAKGLWLIHPSDCIVGAALVCPLKMI